MSKSSGEFKKSTHSYAECTPEGGDAEGVGEPGAGTTNAARQPAWRSDPTRRA